MVDYQTDRLTFRRQFLFSSTPTDKLNNWQFLKIGNQFLYVHPDLTLEHIAKEDASCTLMGYWLDPHQPEASNLQLLAALHDNLDDKEAMHRRLNTLVGRFVLLIRNKGVYHVYHDACGLRSVYYTQKGNGLYVASQPKLFKLVLDLEEAPERLTYYSSHYVKTHKEHWLPCGITLFKNVFQLVPNHYLDGISNTPIRYWPAPEHKIEPSTPEVNAKALGELLTATMNAAHARYPLAFAITSGLDSRLMLSASKNIAKDTFFYTLKYRKLTTAAADIKIPKTLLTQIGCTHHVIDCKQEADSTFLSCYEGNTANPHLNDWGSIAYGIHKGFPQERLAVKANGVEIGRCAFLRDLKSGNPITVELLSDIVPGWKNFDFVKETFAQWLQTLKEIPGLGYDIRDLFYMEHRMGSWQAQSQLEWDIAQEVFVPFNNREVIRLMLSVDPDLRKKDTPVFYIKTIQQLWPEVLDVPINPNSIRATIKRLLVPLRQLKVLAKMRK